MDSRISGPLSESIRLPVDVALNQRASSQERSFQGDERPKQQSTRDTQRAINETHRLRTRSGAAPRLHAGTGTKSKRR